MSKFESGDRKIMSQYRERETSMRDPVGVHRTVTEARTLGGMSARKGVGTLKENPKAVQAAKEGKVPFEYLVLSVLEDDAYVHQHGADKYGVNNWTIDEIRARTYVGAMFRHYKAWAEGEDLDPDSGKPHLTHLRACCAVVMDAQKHGKLIDDRLIAESLSEGSRKMFTKPRCLNCKEAICDECDRDNPTRLVPPGSYC